MEIRLLRKSRKTNMATNFLWQNLRFSKVANVLDTQYYKRFVKKQKDSMATNFLKQNFRFGKLPDDQT